MPNWTYNTVISDSTTMAKVKEIVSDEKGNFDFNKLIPMPPSLNVTSGSSNDIDMYYYLSEKMTLSNKKVSEKPESKLIANMFSKNWLSEIRKRIEKKRADGCLDIDDDAYERGRVLIDNYRQYGATTWYDWCCDNWGTKWNACYTSWEEDRVNFDTAWSAPMPILHKLQDMFPDAKFMIIAEYEDGFLAAYQTVDKRLCLVIEKQLVWDESESEDEDVDEESSCHWITTLENRSVDLTELQEQLEGY